MIQNKMCKTSRLKEIQCNTKLKAHEPYNFDIKSEMVYCTVDFRSELVDILNFQISHNFALQL